MKKFYLLAVACLLLMLRAQLQNVAINTDGSLPNANAILDIKSFSKGLLIPRMSSSARSIIPHTKGLLVYDTTTNSFWYNTGTQWQNMAAAASLSVADSAWLLTGNTGTTDSNFLGTKDNVALNIRVNNQPSGRIDQFFYNTFWGYQAGAASHHDVYYNTGIGTAALGSNTTGAFNTALGGAALTSNTIGAENTAVGVNAMEGNRNGKDNTAIGTNALAFNINGNFNTACGWNALAENFHGNNNTATGAFCLWTSQGDNNVGNGFNTLTNNTTGSKNVAVGAFALIANRTGNDNVATGFNALYWNYDGEANTANGCAALQNNTTGNNNTASGASALQMNSTGSLNTANGVESLHANTTGANNTSAGYRSLYSNTTGYHNAAFGLTALYNNSTGYQNTAIGLSALQSNTIGFNNTASGTDALSANTTGYFNTTDGFRSLHSNITGNNNTAIGCQADVSTGNLSNATALGAGAIVDASNKVRIGNSAITVIEGQVPFTTPSDGRFKFHVQEDVKGLDFILHLRPVTYQFDTKRFDAQWNHVTNKSDAGNYSIQTAYDEATRIRRTGFIAQEVEQAAIKSNYDFSGLIKPKTEQDHYSLSYDAFVVPLVKAVQEQQQEITDLRQQLNEMKKIIASLQPNH